MPQIVFPKSNAPGKTPSETGGRLINCVAEPMAEGAANEFVIRRDAGLRKVFSPVTPGVPRGALYSNGTLYLIVGNKGCSITKAGDVYTVTELTGTVAGTGKVTIAANMKAPTKDILMNTTSGKYTITSSMISTFTDPDLPVANSIIFLGGYFIASIAAGQAYASGINDTTFASVDFASAEAYSDGLKRAVPLGQDLILMGDISIEIWKNTGNEVGFPFTRGPVIPLGLIDTFAVAGFNYGFPGVLAWVANDNRVYKNVFNPTPISPPDLDALIKRVEDKSTIELSVFVCDGRPCLVVKTPDWCWVYNFATQWWHERKSYQSETFDFSLGVQAFDDWFVFDQETGDAYVIDGSAMKEGDQPLVEDIRSAPFHRFPWRNSISRMDFFFRPGQGINSGEAPIETDPSVRISWSDDGGITFKNPVVRKLGEQGKYRTEISVRGTGMTGSQGRQIRMQISDPIDVPFLGGTFEPETRP